MRSGPVIIGYLHSLTSVGDLRGIGISFVEEAY